MTSSNIFISFCRQVATIFIYWSLVLEKYTCIPIKFQYAKSEKKLNNMKSE